jgi:L-ribulokinase
MADRFGLPAGLPLSAAIIDAHAGVPGAGAGEPGTLVMVMGTSSCHMLNSEVLRDIPGVAGVVKDGILPGYFGYETGQAAVGDAFDWLRRLTGQPDFAALSAAAAELPPGAGGVRCVDWFNGCRTPRMDGSLRGAFSGLSLHHGPAHLHRALMEATACGVRWIVDLMREAGVPVRHFIATGGLPHHDPFLIQLHADVLGETIAVPPSRQGPALGAAILGALAAGAFPSAAAAIAAMTSSATPARFHPGPQSGAYHSIYEDYRRSTAR